MKLTKILPLALLTVGLTSCLDDEPIVGDPTTVDNIIEFHDRASASPSAGFIHPVYERAFEVVPTSTFAVNVAYSGSNVAPEDIEVKVEVDEAALNAYNDKVIQDMREALLAEGEDPADAEDEARHENLLFDMISSDLFNLSSNTATIKKGERTATIEVTVKPELFDFAYRYGLPLTISSSSMGTISRNYSTVIYYLFAKNEWDGVYNYKTSANTSLIPNRDATVELHTAGARKLRLVPGLLGYYSNEVLYTIHPDNSITVECPSLGVQQPQDSRSHYDPATKTLHVYWKQGNGGRTFEETIKFLRKRD